MGNKSLGNLLHCLVGDHLKLWDIVLSITEFVYNSLVNRTTGMSPFKIVTGYKIRAPSNLIPMSATYRPSESASNFAQHIHSLHEEIRRKIILSNKTIKGQLILIECIKSFRKKTK